MNQRCRECGSERIAPNVKLVGDDGAPVGGLLPQLTASICGDCGRVTLRAENALDVFLAQQESAPRPAAAGPVAANIQCPSCGSVMAAAAAACEVCGWTDQETDQKTDQKTDQRTDRKADQKADPKKR